MRDFALFPDDDNGDTLWAMSVGDDLSKMREVDFSLIFTTDDNALGFAARMLRNGQKVSFSPYRAGGDHPWQVQVHPVMIPTHEDITRFEELLAAEAMPFHGRNDGWGCFAVPRPAR